MCSTASYGRTIHPDYNEASEMEGYTMRPDTIAVQVL